MPYIKNDDKIHLAGGCRPKDVGELNYLVTTLVHDYIAERKRCYRVYNDVIGVLECAKLELYRRHVAPYEDQKIKENGDVP